MSKVLYLIRYMKSFCMFVKVFTNVLNDLQPYLFSYIVFIMAFSFIIIFMQGEVDKGPNNDEY